MLAQILSITFSGVSVYISKKVVKNFLLVAQDTIKRIKIVNNTEYINFFIVVLYYTSKKPSVDDTFLNLTSLFSPRDNCSLVTL